MLSPIVYHVLRNTGCEPVTDHVVVGKVPTPVEAFLLEQYGVKCEWFAPAGTTYVSAEYEGEFC